MKENSIFREIDACSSPEALFDLIADYFQGQGFGAVSYLTPPGAAGPLMTMNRDIPEDLIAWYHSHDPGRTDPLLRMAFQLGRAVRLPELVESVAGLSAGEQRYIESLKGTRLPEILMIPTYGPFARPGLFTLADPVDPALLDQIDTALLTAVAQQAHARMERLQFRAHTPALSPREREILKWVGQGKSVGDIATILGVAPPTVNTHVQRIYAKFDVRDRASCVAKAISLHYL